MTERRSTDPLLPAEQAIARYGSIREAANHTNLPTRDLLNAWKRINEAHGPHQARNAAGSTPIRHIRIPDDLWQLITAKAAARHKSRATVIVAALRRELSEQEMP